MCILDVVWRHKGKLDTFWSFQSCSCVWFQMSSNRKVLCCIVLSDVPSGWKLTVEYVLNLGVLPLHGMIYWPVKIFVRGCHADKLISETNAASSHCSLRCCITASERHKSTSWHRSWWIWCSRCCKDSAEISLRLELDRWAILGLHKEFFIIIYQTQ